MSHVSVFVPMSGVIRNGQCTIWEPCVSPVSQRSPFAIRSLCQTGSTYSARLVQNRETGEITKGVKQAHVPLEEREIVAACHMAVGGVTILEVQSLFSPAEHLPRSMSTWGPASLASIPVYLLASLWEPAFSLWLCQQPAANRHLHGIDFAHGESCF